MSKYILVYLMWWIAGAIFGLFISQILVADETISLIITMIILGLLAVDIVIFIIQMRRFCK